VLKNRGIPYYLIGVNAIALEMLRKGIKPSCGTKDIDFAIMVSSLDEYHMIVEEFISKGFSRVAKPWRLNHKKF
jgi:predicted nucleotidyltransferase